MLLKVLCIGRFLNISSVERRDVGFEFLGEFIYLWELFWVVSVFCE